jgi:hypothetical protein
MKSNLWVSLLEVIPIPGMGNEREDIPGAFVNGVVPAASAADAEEAFAAALQELGFLMVQAQDTENLQDRRTADRGLSKEIKQLARRARQYGGAQFGSFYTWDRDDPDVDQC